jgi:adenylate kinase
MSRPAAVGVTGTPCTGKKSVARLLASELGLKLLELNVLAPPRSVPDGSGELVVDVKALGRDIRGRRLSGAVVSGHLLADVLRASEVEFVAVLRCDPAVLKRRLASRGYDREKVLENVEAELIGVVLDAAVRRFGPSKVHEYDTSRAKPASVARRIELDLRTGLPQRAPWKDWTLGYDSSTKLRSLLSPPRTDPAST